MRNCPRNCLPYRGRNLRFGLLLLLHAYYTRYSSLRISIRQKGGYIVTPLVLVAFFFGGLVGLFFLTFVKALSDAR